MENSYLSTYTTNSIDPYSKSIVSSEEIVLQKQSHLIQKIRDKLGQ